MGQQVKKHEGCTKLIVNESYRFEVGGKGGSMFEPHATLVVFEKQHERLFTESEVRAMFLDLIEDQARCDVHNGWQSGTIPDFAGIATKHGVSLDPA